MQLHESAGPKCQVRCQVGAPSHFLSILAAKACLPSENHPNFSPDPTTCPSPYPDRFSGLLLMGLSLAKTTCWAGSLTPAQVVHSLKQIILVEVWFDLRKGVESACRASPTPKPSNSLSCTTWAGYYRSKRHPKSTETKTSLCGRPEAPLKTSVPRYQQVLTGINCETQAKKTGWLRRTKRRKSCRKSRRLFVRKPGRLA